MTFLEIDHEIISASILLIYYILNYGHLKVGGIKYFALRHKLRYKQNTDNLTNIIRQIHFDINRYFEISEFEIVSFISNPRPPSKTYKTCNNL